MRLSCVWTAPIHTVPLDACFRTDRANPSVLPMTIGISHQPETLNSGHGMQSARCVLDSKMELNHYTSPWLDVCASLPSGGVIPNRPGPFGPPLLRKPVLLDFAVGTLLCNYVSSVQQVQRIKNASLGHASSLPATVSATSVESTHMSQRVQISTPTPPVYPRVPTHCVLFTFTCKKEHYAVRKVGSEVDSNIP